MHTLLLTHIKQINKLKKDNKINTQMINTMTKKTMITCGRKGDAQKNAKKCVEYNVVKQKHCYGRKGIAKNKLVEAQKNEETNH